ncbi:MAG: DNA-deoxyinosine glycosylase [Planctomycetota bacterium]|nr:MAG: DNA-deoxyinosine glycosylase [Planctomycetota bacterium]
MSPASTRLEGFAPIGAAAPRVLVLGSFPSAASLQAGEYYAHGRNALWPIFERLGIERARPYRERCAALAELGIAVWDVIRSCERAGSLDSAIRAALPNDLCAYAARRPELRTVLLNGRRAEHGFLLATRGRAEFARIDVRLMPSTSPANAHAGKLDAWERVLRAALGRE